MSYPKFLDQKEDGLDPRVQIELERLNSSTDEINKLEVDLDVARNQFRLLLQESTTKIDGCAKKLGSCIVKVRPYYDARIQAKRALQETQKAAVNFERANSAHAAAKEMVFLAEEGLKTEGRTFDHAWQEMLNHATMRVNETESERTRCEAEHKRTSQNYQLIELRVHTLQKELKRAIAKSRPYFELKIHYSQLLEKQKLKVKNLEKQVGEVKLTYAATLKNLERISEEIHKTRQKNKNYLKTETRRQSDFPATKCHEFSTNVNDLDGYCKVPRSLRDDFPNDLGRPEAVSDPESGKTSRIGETNKILSPGSETYLCSRTHTSNTTLSSQPDTDIWSECSDVGNFQVSPSSENDSSITGPADTESEEETFKLAKRLSCFGDISSMRNSTMSGIKESGDGDSRVDSFLEYGERTSDKKSLSNQKPGSEVHCNTHFEGIGICSFPAETELNINFGDSSDNNQNQKKNTDSCWTEIKLRSPEEEIFSMVKVINPGKRKNELEDFDIPYAPLAEVEGDFNEANEIRTNLQNSTLNGVLSGSGLLNTGKPEIKDNEDSSSQSLKGTPKKTKLRRQSLDVLWNSTAGEKVKEILSNSIMKLSIGSLSEKKSNESKFEESIDLGENDNTLNSLKANENIYESNLVSQFGINVFHRKNSKVEDDMQTSSFDDKKEEVRPSGSIPGFLSKKERFFTKKVPNPLGKTLSYLNGDEESNSDNESLGSSDMLTDEQLSSLVLDRDFTEIYQDII